MLRAPEPLLKCAVSPVDARGDLMRVARLSVLLLALGGCVPNAPVVAVITPPSTPAPVVNVDPALPKGFAWARIDGQLLSGSQERTAQARSDIAGCKAETPPSAAEGVPGQECMRERGYYIREL